MSAETQKIDVLAVMDADIDAHEARILRGELSLRAYDDVNRKREARAAVAELIEASRPALIELRAYRDDCESYEAPELVNELEETTDRFAAALARIGGAA